MKSLLESIIDPHLNTYSEDVFEDPDARFPKIKDELRDRIIRDVRKIDKEVKVIDVFIKGSILTKQYTPRSDIDVFVRVKTNMDEDNLREKLYPIWLEIDDKRMVGIPHPLQYYITTLPYDLNNTEAAYSIKDNEWIKKSSSKRIDPSKYMKDYKKFVDQFANWSEEIRRDIIDLDILREIPKKQLKDLDKKVERKLKELEKSLNEYVELYTMLSDFRDKAFSEDMTPSEIKKYGTKVRLPGNVVFKMIERYHYVDLAKKIRKIIGKDGELSKEEYKDLNKILKTNPINPSVKFSEVYTESDLVNDLGPKAGRPQARHQSPKYGAGKTTKMAKMHKKSPLKLDNMLAKTKKNNSRVIRVKQGSPEAHALARKYRIEYPIGKKQVAGNEHDEGITIIFEETLKQKVERAKRELNK